MSFWHSESPHSGHVIFVSCNSYNKQRLFSNKALLTNGFPWCGRSKFCVKMEVTEPHTASRSCPAAVRLGGYGSPPQQYPVTSTPLDTSRTFGWHVVCSRRKREASCHVLATNIWTISLRRHTRLGGMVGQMLKCEWWVLVGLMCAVCYPCLCIEVWCVPSATLVTMCTLKFEFLGVKVSVAPPPPKQLCTQCVPLLFNHSSQSRFWKVNCPFCVCLRIVIGLIVLFHN